MLNKKNKLTLLLIFTIVALFAIVLTGLKSEMALRLGDSYNIKIQGYDPYDPVRGKYIMFTMDTSGVKTSEDIGNSQTRVCYISLTKDKDDFYVLDKAYLDKPQDLPYIKTLMHNYSNDGSYFYASPFDSYFLAEDISQNAEDVLRENIEDAYISIRIWQGSGVVSGMYIDGKTIEKLATEKQ